MPKKSEVYGLNDRQLRAVYLTAQGETGIAIAEEIGITPQTVSEWRRLPAFQAACNRLRQDTVVSVRDGLREAGMTAVEALAEVMKEGPASARVAAASKVLDLLNVANIQTGGMDIGLEDAAKIEEREIEQNLHPLLRGLPGM